ncbi:MAG: proteasome activator [Actinomycetota bacterium]
MTDDLTAPGTPPQSGGGPDVVQAVPVEGGASTAAGAQASAEVGQETITEPAKLLRIASMVRELLDETRQASLDEAGRRRLADVYHRAVGELSEVLSGDLKEELSGLAPPLEGVPTESEIRVAQAQLVGWLEGLFHGIQAAMFAQQAAARAQFEELRRRGLPGQNPSAPEGKTEGPSRGGQYL